MEQLRILNKSVAVIGVDPTSPFTGGALLGDRLRMAKHFSDSGVYIRSMASRGSQGGLSHKSQDVGNILDCAGFDIIIYETVGVGQIELDVMKSSDLFKYCIAAISVGRYSKPPIFGNISEDCQMPFTSFISFITVLPEM